MDLATAERLSSAADPKGLSALKKHSNDPVAAKAVAGQFAALLLRNVMQGSDGAALPMAGDGIGGDIVSGLFASTISQTATSGDTLGLADMLFRSLEATQHTAAAGKKANGGAPGTAAPRAHLDPQAPHGHAPVGGFPLKSYWQENGLRPLVPGAGHIGRSGAGGPIGAVAAARTATGPQGTTSSNAPGSTNLSNSSPSPASNDFSSSSTTPGQVRSFIKELRPMLVQAGRQLGVSPRVLLAHAALETGWGHAVVGNNLFGIKADPSWPGAQITTMTHEVEDGQRLAGEASFRAYPSLDASVQDYVALIGGSPRYQSLIGLGDDAAAYGRGLVAGGYATDTDYGRKLEAVAADPSAAAAFAAPSRSERLGLFADQGLLQ